jgi:hypothetical protein
MIRMRRGQRGSVFTMMMATVAMVGVVGAATMNLVVGPTTTASKVTQHNMAQNDLLMNAKVVVMNASTRPNMGDEDGDGYVEPAPFIPTSDTSCAIALPTGGQGGCLPADIGAVLTDPWGTQYAYCVWDHGDVTGSTNRIDGEDSTSGAVLAIISAGPNKRFETPCSAYDGDPDTPDDAINPNGIGDDLVQIYTYAGAVAGSGGLWELKLNEPETAVIDKKLEVGDVAAGTGFAFDTETGTGEFPYVKTDFLASKSGGTTPVTMDSNIALDGRWLSGDGESEGVFVADNGKVGIGTAAPGSLLQVGEGNIDLTRPTVTIIADDVMDGGTALRVRSAEKEGAASFVAHSSDNSVALAVLEGGDIGIGTSSPLSNVDIRGEGFVNLSLSSNNENNENSVGVDLYTQRNRSDEQVGSGNPSGGNKAWRLGIYAANYTVLQNYVGISHWNGSAWNIAFAISPEGNIGVGTGTSGPTQKLHVSGNVLANQYLHPSDERLKTNIRPVKGFEIISGLLGVSFDWKADGKASAGVIAQDVEAVMPQAVTTGPDGMKSVEYDQLIAPLIEAVKELETRVRHLEADNDNLHGQIRAMTKEER